MQSECNPEIQPAGIHLDLEIEPAGIHLQCIPAG